MDSSIKIGLTGGPGCGKSAAAGILGSFPGWTALDADQVCHEIYEQPYSPWGALLEQRWGKTVIDQNGLPDKKMIAQKVFSDEKERLWLNSVLHPEIHRRIREKVTAAEGKLILIEVPLLFECSWEGSVDCSVAVWSNPDVQMSRLLGRNWTREHALARMNSQFPAEKKLALADYGLINNGSLSELQEQCRELDHILKKRFNII